MSEYGYKVTLEASCGAKRFVAYHDEEFMEFNKAGEEAKYHMAAQSCTRCREHHDEDCYYPVDVLRGEPDHNGEITNWRDAYPTRVDEWAHPELFDGAR